MTEISIQPPTWLVLEAENGFMPVKLLLLKFQATNSVPDLTIDFCKLPDVSSTTMQPRDPKSVWLPFFYRQLLQVVYLAFITSFQNSF